MRSKFLAGSLALSGASFALTAHAQTPYLVTDVEPAVTPGYARRPTQLTPADDALFFFGTTPSGRGLFRSDGAGTPTLVRQLRDESSGAPSELFRVMTSAGSRVFFTAEGGLWVSDGTPFGTSMIKSLPRQSAGSVIANAAGTIYFVAWDGGESQLWKSDGTPAGTVRVASVSVRSMVTAGPRLFFVSNDYGLWTSDGTEAGTVRLVQATVSSTAFRPIAALDGVVLFANGAGQLWRSDGTEAGTVRVGTVSGLGGLFTRRGNEIFFVTAATPALWKTDGTDEGTVVVKDGLLVRALDDAGSALFLHGVDAAAGAELWVSDGTTAGTHVLDVCAGPCSFLNAATTFFAALPGGVAFARAGARDLWKTDGTVAGTVLLADQLPPSTNLGSEVNSLAPFDGSVFFITGDGTGVEGGEALWQTDGTPAGTARVELGTIGTSSSPAMAGEAGDRAVFSASRSDVGRELWSTTGTPESTQLVDLAPGPTAAAWKPVASVADTFLFARFPEQSNQQVWRTDGTAAGTEPIPGFRADGERSAVNGDAAVFAQIEALPVRSDGTPEGTSEVELPAGGIYNLAVGASPDAIAPWGDGFAVALFAVSAERSGIWLTDGEGGTREVEVGQPYCNWVEPVDERLFIGCYGGGGPSALWTSDGSYSGSRLAAVLPGIPQAGASALDGKLYFAVEDDAGATLWVSDGTTSGTVPFSTIATVPGPVSALTVSNGVLYFAGFTAATGRELWRTDGTAAGTFMLRDIDPGAASGIDAAVGEGAAIVPSAGGVLFAARTAATGAELWRSDGTRSGTLPAAEIAPGPASSSPGQMREVGSRMYFAAWTAAHGREVWALDLPPAAVSVTDAHVSEGDSGTSPVKFQVRLASPAAVPVTVSYTTVPGTAQAGGDFVSAAGVLTFPPGTVQLPVVVEVVGDAVDETNEAFRLDVTSALGASIADGRGTAVIVDDDQPRVAVADASVSEGDAGETMAAFPVTLTTSDGQPTPVAVVIRGQVIPDTAGDADFPSFLLGWPALAFPAGTASGTTLSLLVPVRGDTFEEPNETFQVRLDPQNDAVVVGGSASGVILDDDGIAARPPVEIAHGSRITADLAPPAGRTSDVDFYVLRHEVHSSYEVVLDGVSGDTAPITLERVAADGGVFQVAAATGTGGSVALRFFGLGTSGEHLRVRSAGCGSSCGADDVYRLRMYETTLSAPRVNTTGTQATALVLQNITDRPVQAVAAFWSEGGVLSGLQLLNAPPHGTTVLDVGTVVPQFAGSLTVGHDAPYGTLAGKVVSLDPATGLAFETVLTAKPR